MKTKGFWLVMLALALTLGLTVVGCNDKDDGDDAFTGTWSYINTSNENNGPPSMKLVAQNGTIKVYIIIKDEEAECYRANYTVSGNKVDITFTQINVGWLSNESDKWEDYDSIQDIDDIPPKNVSGTISDDKFILSFDDEEDDIIFTKQS